MTDELCLGEKIQGHPYKIITSCRERLDYCHLVPVYILTGGFSSREIEHQDEGRGPHDDEIEDLRDKDSEYRTKVVNYSVSLVCKQDDDRVQQSK